MARGLALGVDPEHRLLADVAALAVVEELRERGLEREAAVVDVDAVAEQARLDAGDLDLGRGGGEVELGQVEVVLGQQLQGSQFLAGQFVRRTRPIGMSSS